MNIELNIEELVLNGFEDVENDRLVEIIQRELSRLLTEEGVPPALAQGRALPDLLAPDFNFAPETSADAMGNQMAQAIYTAFGEQ